MAEINPDALSIAQSLDEERGAGKLRGYVASVPGLSLPNVNGCRPLHGIPILLKDNIATMDEMNNTGRPVRQ